MGSFANANGTVVIPSAALAPLRAHLLDEWGTYCWSDLDKTALTGDPASDLSVIIGTILRNEFGDRDGFALEDAYEPGDQTAQYEVTIFVKLGDYLDQILKALTECGATGVLDWDGDEGHSRTRLIDGEVREFYGQTAYPNDPDAPALLGSEQSKAADTLANVLRCGSPETIAAAATDLLVALRGTPLIETD